MFMGKKFRTSYKKRSYREAKLLGKSWLNTLLCAGSNILKEESCRGFIPTMRNTVHPPY